MAEVLITLGIIGIVAAMTFPSFNADYSDKKDIAKLKKVYAVLQQANSGAVAKYGDVKYWGSLENSLTYISAELKVMHKYEILSRVYGFSDYKTLLGNSNGYNGILTYTSGIMLNDGTIVGVIGYSTSEGTSLERCIADKSQYCYLLQVDINGLAEPNRYGYDVFVFNVMPDNKVRPSTTLKRCTPAHESSSDGHPNGESCAAWVLLNDNMYYKKCIKGNKKYCNIDFDILKQ